MNCKPTSKSVIRHKRNLCLTKDSKQRFTKDWQDIPERFIKKSLDVRKLLQNNNSMVYAYVLTSVSHDIVKDKFIQEGCSPNFEGGIATLCCCKHHMRAYPNIKENIWIAGFTGASQKYGSKNKLYYLAKIKEIKYSFSELKEYLGEEITLAKDARYHKLGDIYVMKSKEKDPDNIRSYHTPCGNHVHWKNDSWEYDITYKPKKLLAFEKANTYVWEKPVYQSESFIGRGSRKFESCNEFLKILKSCKK